jgi:predicted O-methyltransferase YrrM
LPADGRLITLESEPRHVDVARANIARAGLQQIVEFRLGAALETLPKLVAENSGPFDLIFLDADKESYPDYLPWLV